MSVAITSFPSAPRAGFMVGSWLALVNLPVISFGHATLELKQIPSDSRAPSAQTISSYRMTNGRTRNSDASGLPFRASHISAQPLTAFQVTSRTASYSLESSDWSIVCDGVTRSTPERERTFSRPAGAGHLERWYSGPVGLPCATAFSNLPARAGHGRGGTASRRAFFARRAKALGTRPGFGYANNMADREACRLYRELKP